jgi:3-oxoacyl-[acyl-carrier-protein] synthase II
MADVVITGIGLVTPLGTTTDETRRAWLDGACAARASLPELRLTPLENYPVAQLPPLDAAARLGSRRMLKYMSHAAVLGCVAAHEAVAESGAMRRFAAERIGLYAGTGIAAADAADVHELVEQSIDSAGRFSCRLLGERGLSAANPLISFRILANMPACLVSLIEGIKGPNLIFTPWEAQAAAALEEAWRAVATGEVDCAVAGAADSAGHPATVVYLQQAGLLAADEFPTSGAGYIVMERHETARRDGVGIRARMNAIECGVTDDGAPDPVSARMGRAYAAAPAIMLGVQAATGTPSMSTRGVDGSRVGITLEPAS